MKCYKVLNVELWESCIGSRLLHEPLDYFNKIFGHSLWICLVHQPLLQKPSYLEVPSFAWGKLKVNVKFGYLPDTLA